LTNKAPPCAQRYIERHAGPIHWKEVDEGWAGYAELTGQTFVIDAITRYVFDLISENNAGQSLDDLTQQLMQDLDEPPNKSDLRARTEMALELLCRHDLVETRPFESR